MELSRRLLFSPRRTASPHINNAHPAAPLRALCFALKYVSLGALGGIKTPPAFSLLRAGLQAACWLPCIQSCPLHSPQHLTGKPPLNYIHSGDLAYAHFANAQASGYAVPQVSFPLSQFAWRPLRSLSPLRPPSLKNSKPCTNPKYLQLINYFFPQLISSQPQIIPTRTPSNHQPAAPQIAPPSLADRIALRFNSSRG